MWGGVCGFAGIRFIVAYDVAWLCVSMGRFGFSWGVSWVALVYEDCNIG